MMVFLFYPPCSTCKKAKQWLDGHGIAYTPRHIREQNPTYEELSRWLEQSGLPVKRFFNTSGLHYKALGLKDKLPGMTVEEQVITDDGKLLVGFREAEWESTLL